MTPSETEHGRFVEAYIQMWHKAKYRPGAPSDDMGGLVLSEKDLADPDILQQEANEYATHFIEEIESRKGIYMGIPNWSGNRALFWCIEAARLTCGGDSSNPYAEKVVRLALAELEEVNQKRRLKK